jgi:hypothetical protein
VLAGVGEGVKGDELWKRFLFLRIVAAPALRAPSGSAPCPRRQPMLQGNKYGHGRCSGCGWACCFSSVDLKFQVDPATGLFSGARIPPPLTAHNANPRQFPAKPSFPVVSRFPVRHPHPWPTSNATLAGNTGISRSHPSRMPRCARAISNPFFSFVQVIRSRRIWGLAGMVKRV